MRVLYREKLAGKTINLLHIAHDNKAAMVCQNDEACRQLEVLAKDDGLDIPMFLTFNDLFSGRCSWLHNGCPLVIDDVDSLLQGYANKSPIIAISLLKDEPVECINIFALQLLEERIGVLHKKIAAIKVYTDLLKNIADLTTDKAEKQDALVRMRSNKNFLVDLCHALDDLIRQHTEESTGRSLAEE